MSEELEQFDGVDDVTEAVAEPEPVAEVAPEPEFEYEPEFLGEQPEPQYQEPQWSPQQVAAYREQMTQPPYQQPRQQYQQPPPQQQHQNMAEETLNRLVRNPDGTISEIAGHTAQQVAQQMMSQYMNPMGQQLQHFIQGQANHYTATSDETIKSMYKKEFSKDETFASNERVRARVNTAIQGLRQQAIMQARGGDPSGFAIFNNPTFSKGVLALAKIMEGHTPTASEVAAIPHIERTTPATKKVSSQETDPNMRSALQRVGISEERYLKGLEDQAKYNDFTG